MKSEDYADTIPHHPAIQKLRFYLREYIEQGGSLILFTRKLGTAYNSVTRYLRGETLPRRCTIMKWAEAFGVTYEEMMTPPEEYVPYPFERLSQPKKGGLYLSRKAVRREYRNGLLEDYDFLVQEGKVEYSADLVKILTKPRV